MQTAITHVIEAHDEAMEEFRKQFRLVAGCEVSADGFRMTYQLKTLSGAINWLSNAKGVINANKLPLVAGVKVRQELGKEVEGVELRIVYKP